MAAVSYDDVLARNIALIARVCKRSAAENSRFIDDLALDSIDLVGLVADMEEEFGVIVPEEKLHSLRTVADATRCICELTPERVA
jgi:acyl carrier protein